VDDDPAIREIFTEYLRMEGYDTLEAPGGRECQDVLEQRKPDLILLDLMMEPMDGWTTLQAIRNSPAHAWIPVIIITGKSPVPEEIYRYGFFIEDYIVKPIDFRQAAASLQQIIAAKRDLRVELDRIGLREKDPEVLDEYSRFISLVRVAHRIWKRFKDPQSGDQAFLVKKEEHLQWLHKQLGLPDRLLEWEQKRIQAVSGGRGG
jgi:DNA-binding response OmpR family regulator